MKRAAYAPTLMPLAGMLPHASEGLERPIIGPLTYSYSGFIRPASGGNWAISNAFYDGFIGASRQAPSSGGGTSLGLSAQFQPLSFTGLHICNTKAPSCHCASMVWVPFEYADISVNVRLGTLKKNRKDTNTTCSI